MLVGKLAAQERERERRGEIRKIKGEKHVKADEEADEVSMCLSRG